MRRISLLGAIFTLAFAGVALAAYRPGFYHAGSSSGTGIDLRIKHGSFSVSRVSFEETCSNESGSFTEPFTFEKGSQAKLAGKVKKKGRLSGRYEGPGGVVTITGRVKRSRATLKVSESGSFTNESGTYDCQGSRTFHAKRLEVTGGG